MGTFRAILGNGSPVFPITPLWPGLVLRTELVRALPLQRQTRAPAPRPQATYLGKASNQ